MSSQHRSQQTDQVPAYRSVSGADSYGSDSYSEDPNSIESLSYQLGKYAHIFPQHPGMTTANLSSRMGTLEPLPDSLTIPRPVSEPSSNHGQTHPRLLGSSNARVRGGRHYHPPPPPNRQPLNPTSAMDDHLIQAYVDAWSMARAHAVRENEGDMVILGLDLGVQEVMKPRTTPSNWLTVSTTSVSSPAQADAIE
ncbi:hypothetical protein V5O48_008166 [Marasmius crinis-equi]|uniref:Uncharacterized protein n=1 Tax=Marasmius crinis-equi TaxID=585013 RepID=A0ABR3FF67_9AGAR